MRSNTRKKSLIQQIKRDENEVELELSQIYKLFSKGQEFISIPQFLKLFDKFGFLPDDPRWKDFFENINKLERIDEQIFCKQF
jgi:glutaminase